MTGRGYHRERAPRIDTPPGAQRREETIESREAEVERCCTGRRPAWAIRGGEGIIEAVGGQSGALSGSPPQLGAGGHSGVEAARRAHTCSLAAGANWALHLLLLLHSPRWPGCLCRPALLAS